MSLRALLNLLYAGIFGVLFTLSVMLGYSLGGNENKLVSNAKNAAETTTKGNAEKLPDPARRGKAVWRDNGCGSCHAKDMKTKLTGPALGGVTDRWAEHPRTDLYAWVRNSGALIDTGHPRAVAVYEANKRIPMPSYLHLTDEDIEALLAYIEG